MEPGIILMSNVSIDYKASPTGVLFHQSDSFVRGIMGPFGSGKSVTVCFEIFLRMKKQSPGLDGIRRTRWIIARNTFNELETTTMETWRDWFPENVFGAISRKPPYRQKVKFDDVEAEVIFLALDKPEDQKKLLSFEVTGIWFNEARQIDQAIISAALGRVGRYPSKKDKPDYVDGNSWPTWSGILLDTNPPDDEHWYYKAAEEQSWAVNEMGDKVDLDTIPPSRRWAFFRQPSGLSSDAENVNNLPGGQDYYKRMLGGNTKEWVDVHVHGNYGFIKTGTPVFEGYWAADLMTRQFETKQGGTIWVGIDASGRHPASIFAQKTQLGQWQIVDELCITDDFGMGAENYTRLVKQKLVTDFQNHHFEIFGDPAGGWKSQNNEQTYFDILHAGGIDVRGAPDLPKNSIRLRLETVKSTMSRLINGQPGIIIHPRCKQLLRGFNGGYQLRAASTATNDAVPEKNRFSDAQDALQYVLAGGGETKRLIGRGRPSIGKSFVANTEFSIFG